MKPGPVSKIDKKYNGNENDIMSANCDIIVSFPIYGQFGAIRKPDVGCIACKSFIFVNNNFLFYKNYKQN